MQSKSKILYRLRLITTTFEAYFFHVTGQGTEAQRSRRDVARDPLASNW